MTAYVLRDCKTMRFVKGIKNGVVQLSDITQAKLFTTAKAADRYRKRIHGWNHQILEVEVKIEVIRPVVARSQ